MPWNDPQALGMALAQPQQQQGGMSGAPTFMTGQQFSSIPPQLQGLFSMFNMPRLAQRMQGGGAAGPAPSMPPAMMPQGYRLPAGKPLQPAGVPAWAGDNDADDKGLKQLFGLGGKPGPWQTSVVPTQQGGSNG